MSGSVSPSVGVVLVTTTLDSAEVAEQLSRSAVEARLAACGQASGPITSTYWWDGALASAQEWVVTFKTVETASEALIGHLLAVHPYDVPEIVVTPVTGGNPAYLRWVADEVRS
jgi:periplasmic divalent cation tolerance protein